MRRAGCGRKYRPGGSRDTGGLARDPKLVWDWYAWRRGLIAHAQPNAGHHALVALARCIPGFTLVTQNVDGLHQRAGSTDVIEFHGNIGRTRCTREGLLVEETMPAADDVVRRCPRCGAWLRPDVVWFGEAIPTAALERRVRGGEAL